MKNTIILFLLASVLVIQESQAQNWTPVAQMSTPRAGHFSTMMNDGRILITGGGLDWQTSFASADVFDYRNSTTVAVPDMAEARLWHQSVLLDDGRVLIAGGASRIGSALNSCQIFDPQTNDWSAAAPMNFRRERLAMVKLPDGRVMAIGGIGGEANDTRHRSTPTCELYDPATDTWTYTAPMTFERNAHQAIVLQDGRVLVTTGYSSQNVYRTNCDIYDPTTDTWMPTGSFLERGTGDHRMSMLSDGTVLRTGGWAGPQAFSELFNPAAGTWTATGQLNWRRSAHAQLTLPDDRVMVIGGSDGFLDPQTNSPDAASVEEFDPNTRSWRQLESLPRPLEFLTAHYTPDGQIIVIGGARIDGERPPTNVSDVIFSSYYGSDVNSAVVSGSIFRDYDADGQMGPNDAPAANVKLEITPGPHYVFTDADGMYAAFLPPGQYEVCVQETANWYTSWTHTGDDCYEVMLADIDSEVQDVDFALTPSRLVSELDLCIVASQPRPGFSVFYHLSYTNSGTVPFSGYLTFSFDPLLELVASTPPATQTNVSSMDWLLEDVPVGETRTIVVEFKVPADVGLLGQELCTELEYERKNREDQVLRDGKDRFCSEIRGAYDPNEIIVTPRGVGPEGRIALDVNTLSYTIYFQNLGTDAAFNVRIENPIEADLDISSFEFGHSSHDVEVSIGANRIMTFTFNDIMLPHKAADEAGSQGFVRYYIKPLTDVVAQEVKVTNDAGIFFDFNPPIFTNTTLNTLSPSITSVDDGAATLGPQSLRLSPNPASTSFVVDGFTAVPQTVKLLDILGNEHALPWSFGGAQLELDGSQLAGGTYWLSLGFTDGATLSLPVIIAR